MHDVLKMPKGVSTHDATSGLFRAAADGVSFVLPWSARVNQRRLRAKQRVFICVVPNVDCAVEKNHRRSTCYWVGFMQAVI